MFCVLLSRYFISLLFSYVFYATYEYFPNSISSRAFAFCNTVSRIVTILAPMAVELLDQPFMLLLPIALASAGFNLRLMKEEETETMKGNLQYKQEEDDQELAEIGLPGTKENPESPIIQNAFQ